MKTILKQIHFIWFGSFPKSEALANIKNTIDTNPDHVCYLWSSPRTLSPVEWSVLEGWCRENLLVLRNVDELIGSREELTNKGSIIDMLGEGIKRKNSDSSGTPTSNKTSEFWRAASDLLRIALLIKYAGFYIDVKTQITKPLSLIEAPFGFLMDFGKDASSLNTKFHIFAANEPNLDIFVEAAKVQKKTLDIAQDGHAWLWSDWLSRPSPFFTILLTGSPMGSALKILGYDIRSIPQIQFPTEYFTLLSERTCGMPPRDQFALCSEVCSPLARWVESEVKQKTEQKGAETSSEASDSSTFHMKI